MTRHGELPNGNFSDPRSKRKFHYDHLRKVRMAETAIGGLPFFTSKMALLYSIHMYTCADLFFANFNHRRPVTQSLKRSAQQLSHGG